MILAPVSVVYIIKHVFYRHYSVCTPGIPVVLLNNGSSLPFWQTDILVSVIHKHGVTVCIIIFIFLFFKFFWTTWVFLWGHWYSCFGLLWHLPWVSKPGWIPRLRASSPVHSGCLRFTSGATPADPLACVLLRYYLLRALLIKSDQHNGAYCTLTSRCSWITVSYWERQLVSKDARIPGVVCASGSRV